MKFLIHRAAPSAMAVGLLLLPFGAQAATASQSLEARLQEALGGVSIVHLAAMSSPENESSAAQLLSASLPSGVSLKSASDDQVTEAVKAAVAQDPNMAASIVRVAIITKVPASERNAAPKKTYRRQSQSEDKSLSQNSTYNPWATAGVTGATPRVYIAAVTRNADGFIYRLIFNAVSTVKGQAAAIVREAIRVAPAFAVTITRAALDALAGEDEALRREIIGVAQLAAPNQSGALAQLGSTSGGSLGVLTSGGLGASPLGGAPQGAGVINPSNIGAGTQDTTTDTSASTQPQG